MCPTTLRSANFAQQGSAANSPQVRVDGEVEHRPEDRVHPRQVRLVAGNVNRVPRDVFDKLRVAVWQMPLDLGDPLSPVDRHQMQVERDFSVQRE